MVLFWAETFSFSFLFQLIKIFSLLEWCKLILCFALFSSQRCCTFILYYETASKIDHQFCFYCCRTMKNCDKIYLEGKRPKKFVFIILFSFNAFSCFSFLCFCLFLFDYNRSFKMVSIKMKWILDVQLVVFLSLFVLICFGEVSFFLLNSSRWNGKIASIESFLEYPKNWE